MLQNPSKYHANPLSHFLALHNTQANSVAQAQAHAHAQAQAHGHGHGQLQPHHALPSAALAAAAAAAAVTAAGQSSYQMELHSNQQQQQQQQQLPIGLPTPTQTQADTHNQQREQQQQQQLATATSHAQLIEAAAAHTSLDVGKSFTIAAILGLQQQSKDYNNAINLSLNGANSAGGGADDQDNNNSKFYNNNNNNNNANNNNNNNSYGTSSNNNNNSQSVNNFNCDSSGSRYLATVQHPHPHPHPHSHSHSQQRANFAAAAVVAAAVSGAPSALQSLQQLHQHHAQQASLSFQRDKLKSDSQKKSALKNKRVRTIFTPEQLECLEAEFERQQYMVGPERLYLAHTLKLTEAQVKVWFQNRRIKWRKHHLELTQQRLALIRQTQLPGGAAATAATGSINTAVELPLNAGCSTASPSLLEEDNDNEDSKQSLSLPLRPLSRAASESDLSICNDSLDLDGDSLMDGSEEA